MSADLSPFHFPLPLVSQGWASDTLLTNGGKSTEASGKVCLTCKKKEKKKITDRDMPLFTFELCVRERCLELLEPSFIYKKGGDENYREADTEP